MEHQIVDACWVYWFVVKYCSSIHPLLISIAKLWAVYHIFNHLQWFLWVILILHKRCYINILFDCIYIPYVLTSVVLWALTLGMISDLWNALWPLKRSLTFESIFDLWNDLWPLKWSLTFEMILTCLALDLSPLYVVS